MIPRLTVISEDRFKHSIDLWAVIAEEYGFTVVPEGENAITIYPYLEGDKVFLTIERSPEVKGKGRERFSYSIPIEIELSKPAEYEETLVKAIERRPQWYSMTPREAKAFRLLLDILIKLLALSRYTKGRGKS